MTEVPIHTPFIQLDALLKFAGVCETGGEAKWRVADGEVSVNGMLCSKRGKKIYPGDVVELEEVSLRVVAQTEED